MGIEELIGKKYYELSEEEKWKVVDLFKQGRKNQVKLIIELPFDADEQLKSRLEMGIWEIHEMNHKDALGVVVKVEQLGSL